MTMSPDKFVKFRGKFDVVSRMAMTPDEFVKFRGKFDAVSRMTTKEEH